MIRLFRYLRIVRRTSKRTGQSMWRLIRLDWHARRRMKD